jgi:phosphopantetheinyl transferase
MDVYWLEQTEADVPEENDWLSSNEIVLLDRLRFPSRRAAWRLGRWTAKRAVAALMNCDGFSTYARIEIRPASSGAPDVFFDDKPSPLSISLSHRTDRAICALAPHAVQLGCDLELIEPHSSAFITDYFTAEEQTFIAHQPAADQQRLPALLWSAKESALKALHAGLRLDTRSVVVDPATLSTEVCAWRPLTVRYTRDQVFRGWWQTADNMVRTIVAVPPPAQPIPLSTSQLSQ